MIFYFFLSGLYFEDIAKIVLNVKKRCFKKLFKIKAVIKKKKKGKFMIYIYIEKHTRLF